MLKSGGKKEDLPTVSALHCFLKHNKHLSTKYTSLQKEPVLQNEKLYKNYTTKTHLCKKNSTISLKPSVKKKSTIFLKPSVKKKSTILKHMHLCKKNSTIFLKHLFFTANFGGNHLPPIHSINKLSKQRHKEMHAIYNYS